MRGKSREMDLRATRFFDQLLHVVGAYTAAGQYFDAFAGSGDQVPDRVPAFHRRFFPAAGEHASETDINEFVEGAMGVKHNIEGPMEDSLLAVSEFENLSAARDVNASVGSKDAEHDSIGPVLEEKRNITLHDVEVSIRIAKARSTRAHHGHHRNTYTLPGLDEGTERRGQASGRDRGA